MINLRNRRERKGRNGEEWGTEEIWGTEGGKETWKAPIYDERNDEYKESGRKVNRKSNLKRRPLGLIMFERN